MKKIASSRIREDVIISLELARSLCELSFEINRQIGILIKRNGHISHLFVGNHHSVYIPDLGRSRYTKLRELRLVHTHLKGEELNSEDLYDLTLLRLDYITAITLDNHGLPKFFHNAYLVPGTKLGYQIEKPILANLSNSGLSQTLSYLDDLFKQEEQKLRLANTESRVFLVGVYTPEMYHKRAPKDSISELGELCKTAKLTIVDKILQKRKKLDPSSLLGSGKIKEIALEAIQKNAEFLIFDLELSPSQAKKLSELCNLKIIDRTQLILDIFSQNAHNRDGKLQVELAQLRYLKGRLSEKDDNMSRLTGGIGGRGPGETKLEIGRRRVNDRIRRLEKELDKLKAHRSIQRNRRKNNIPIVSIVGYTNAGKSTLLNVLTNSDVLTENRLFATLEPTNRRLRFPQEREIILSDTVGFIHDLPPELKRAFASTLEELQDADLLLHCIDSSDKDKNKKINSVNAILLDISLVSTKCIRVFNKSDMIDQEEINFLNKEENSICISAQKKRNLHALLQLIEDKLFN